MRKKTKLNIFKFDLIFPEIMLICQKKYEEIYDRIIIFNIIIFLKEIILINFFFFFFLRSIFSLISFF